MCILGHVDTGVDVYMCLYMCGYGCGCGCVYVCLCMCWGVYRYAFMKKEEVYVYVHVGEWIDVCY